MSWLRRVRHERQARQELGELTHHLHRAGLSIGALAPGLLARVDQHAAAVRDILLFSGGRMGPIELAGYARGIRDAATESGWSVLTPDEDGGADWGWVDLRLAAVCLLARAEPSEKLRSALPAAP